MRALDVHSLCTKKKCRAQRPGEVQQGGEDVERKSIIAFETSDSAAFLTNQEKKRDYFARPLCVMCMALVGAAILALRPEFCGGVRRSLLARNRGKH